LLSVTEPALKGFSIRVGEAMSKVADHHELSTAVEHLETPTDRSFGLVFSAMFSLLAAYLLWQGSSWWPVPLALAPTMLALALLNPTLLAPFNFLWTRFGLLLGALVAPIVMGIIYFIVITPVGMFARSLNKDFLRLRRNSTASSYWLQRGDGRPSPERLRDQF
jgi:hypothetical protein